MSERERVRAQRAGGQGTVAPRPPRAGRPLDAHTAARMGAAYGHSFAHVRIHDDAEAASQVARERAIAVTTGSEIAFAPGHYRPGTQVGDALLAHELAHVQQQREGVDAPGAAHERDAHEATVGAVAHLAGAPGAPRRGPSMRSAVAPQRCGGLPSWAPPMPEGALTPSNGKKFVAGAMVDKMLMGSPTIGRYVTRKSKTGTPASCGRTIPPVPASEGRYRYHQPSEWTQVAMADAAGKHNPFVDRCDDKFTEEEARGVAPGLKAFWSPREDKIHINEATADETAPIHEGIHRYLDNRFLEAVGKAAEEGACEYFAGIVRDEQEPKLVAKEQLYETQRYAISVMADVAGVDAVADAYFNGNLERLRAAVDKAQPGRFSAWCDAAKRGDFEGANTLFGKSMINRIRENPFGR